MLLRLISIILLACLLKSCSDIVTYRPNIIIILADDMGFSDLGCYGSEIATPNLDRLALEGMRLTRFYNCARCCPTRAALLTGMYHHKSGMGTMADNHFPLPGYTGYLSRNAVTIAEVLKNAGYITYMSGKWHVGDIEETWPGNRGFDKSFAFLNGASSYFNIKPYRDTSWAYGRILRIMLNNQDYFPPDTGFYMTDAFTDYAVRFINEHDNQNPFFLYLAYTAPHWPLHALPEDIRKYEGRYEAGWEVLREERFARQKELGLFDSSVELSGRLEYAPLWDTLSQESKVSYANKMEVYAAMIDKMDQGIGRLIQTLKEKDISDNTLVIFLSDNGACAAEGIGYTSMIPTNGPVGSPESFEAAGSGWANASNTPFRYHKSRMHEGGIATPFIAWYPRMIKPGTIESGPAHVIDLMPTCLELAGTGYPEQYGEWNILPIDGKSIVPLLKGKKFDPHKTIYWEHIGSRAALKGNWKLVSLRENEPWELYELAGDRTEMNDLSTEMPEKSEELEQIYQNWADSNFVLPWSKVQESR